MDPYFFGFQTPPVKTFEGQITVDDCVHAFRGLSFPMDDLEICSTRSVWLQITQHVLVTGIAREGNSALTGTKCGFASIPRDWECLNCVCGAPARVRMFVVVEDATSPAFGSKTMLKHFVNYFSIDIFTS